MNDNCSLKAHQVYISYMLTLYILNQLNHLLKFKLTGRERWFNLYHMKESDNFATNSATLAETKMYIPLRKYF